MATASSGDAAGRVWTIMGTLFVAVVVGAAGVLWNHESRISTLEQKGAYAENVPTDLAATRATVDDLRERQRQMDSKIDRLLEAQSRGRK